MAQTGIGENSPIILQLERENFNALIGRHGQYVRWLISETCPCVGSNRRADENCPLCRGDGISYRDPERSERIKSFKAVLDNVIEVPDNDGIIWVRTSKGVEVSVVASCENFVTVSGTVKKGEEVFVKYYENVRLSGSGTAEYIEENLYQIDINKTVESGS